VPPSTFSHVKCHGLLGTYGDGLAWLAKPENKVESKCILTLGSSIGNFSREDAAEFLSGFAQVLNPSDSILVGIDACQDKQRVYSAYNDKQGVTQSFYRNGLSRANVLLGHEAFKLEEWEVVGAYNERAQRHEAFFSPLKDVTINEIPLLRGERIRLEEAYKYSPAQSEALCHAAGLYPAAIFGNSGDNYREQSSFSLPYLYHTLHPSPLKL
jgi:EasF-like predicted methyltransferase